MLMLMYEMYFGDQLTVLSSLVLLVKLHLNWVQLLEEVFCFELPQVKGGRSD